MYALIRVVRQGAASHIQHTLYGICGNRRLLEKIRTGQEHPKEWRIIAVALTVPLQYGLAQRKAG